MAEKIMLIDGNSIINRAFYGVPLLTNAEGRYTNAVYGFFNILFKLLPYVVLANAQPVFCLILFSVSIFERIDILLSLIPFSHFVREKSSDYHKNTGCKK